MTRFDLYEEGVRRAGGEPVVVRERLDPELLDGILVPGGWDIHPRHYGEERQPVVKNIDQLRDELELDLTREALARGLPVFGICRGVQLLNMALGGTLHQDLGSRNSVHERSQAFGLDFEAHGVEVARGSALGELAGPGRLPVNSFHHQAVKEPAPGLRVTATSEDGVVEALESVDGRVVAVQWHPERMLGRPAADRFFERLVELSKTR